MNRYFVCICFFSYHIISKCWRFRHSMFLIWYILWPLRTHFLIHCSVLQVQPIGPSHTLATGSQQGLGEWLLLQALRANFYEFPINWTRNKGTFSTFPYIFYAWWYIMFQHFLGAKDSLPVSLWFESIFLGLHDPMVLVTMVPWKMAEGIPSSNVLRFVYLVNCLQVTF